MPADYAVQDADLTLPPRVVVDGHGHYWRDYGAFWSMCPVSEENVSTEAVASFSLDTDPSLHEMEIAAYDNAARAVAAALLTPTRSLEEKICRRYFNGEQTVCKVHGEPSIRCEDWEAGRTFALAATTEGDK